MFAAGVTVHSADPPRRFQELARELDLALLRGTRDAMRALAHVARWRQVRLRDEDRPAPDVRDLLPGPGPLSEHESALVLERYGVPFAERRRAATPEEAAAAAVELGFPVVVKVDGVTHKAREGGVLVGDRLAATRRRRRRAVSAAGCSSRGRSRPASRRSAG